MGDLVIVFLILSASILDSKFGIQYLLPIVVLLCLLKYGIVDLRRYKNGSDVRGVLGYQLHRLEKLGGRGFALGFTFTLLALMLVVISIMLLITLMRSW